MIALLILFACLSVALSGSSGVIVDGHALRYAKNYSVVSGHALYYGKGQMERVYRVRIRQGLVDAGWRGALAAVPDCSHIGEIVSARINGGAWTNYLVVDCAMSEHYQMQIRTGRVIEVDYWSAYRNGFVSKGRAPATVWYGR